MFFLLIDHAGKSKASKQARNYYIYIYMYIYGLYVPEKGAHYALSIH